MEETDRHPDTDASVSGSAPGLDAHPAFEESLTDELAALIDDGRTYLEAEAAFQKTRAKLAGKSVGIVVVCAILALILLNIAFLALAVGLVIALEPLVNIWWAIAIVVGALFLIVGALGWIAFRRVSLLSAIFASSDDTEHADGEA
ncbi:MAG: phage holin family protein [Erythrobacter sp.]